MDSMVPYFLGESRLSPEEGALINDEATHLPSENDSRPGEDCLMLGMAVPLLSGSQKTSVWVGATSMVRE